MTAPGLVRVERLVRDLIAESGLTATLLAVQHQAARWLIAIRLGSGRVFDLELPDTLTVAELRSQIEHQLLTRI